MLAVSAGRMLGIQSLRNSILSATYFATATLTLGFFSANEALNFCGFDRTQQWALTLSFFWSFLHWLICIKAFTHLTFIISMGDFSHKLSQEEIDDKNEREIYAQTLVVNATFHYFMAIRLFFFAIIIAGWILHPYACIAITIITLIYLFISDHSYGHYI
eukprot:TRINITY_DN974_c0_g2_i3.p1 TRINITY_DN974_c0_g2~~TRINITY_DN974_c0_g2_i3.p1  ORF type:complete len:160 (+),score=20.76 TRINITY_DN974_c0_g2_i3:263-742(+)